MDIKKTKAWIKASRIPAQTFIFPSILLGQLIRFSINGELNWYIFIFAHTYGLCMHLFIVYANDYADYETDKLNTTYTAFTGGSRVLVEEILTKKEVLFSSVVMAIMCVIMGAILSYYAGNWIILLLIILGILLLQAYSFRPMKISYAGFGELLQMIGVGIILPLIGYVSQGGGLKEFPWGIMIIILPSQLAMAISTSLPDAPSDRMSSKRTTVVVLGEYKAKVLIVLLYIISLVSMLIYNRTFFVEFNGFIFIFMVFALILSQLFLSINYPIKPGSKMISYSVLLSILTNTIIMLGISLIIFI